MSKTLILLNIKTNFDQSVSFDFNMIKSFIFLKYSEL